MEKSKSKLKGKYPEQSKLKQFNHWRIAQTRKLRNCLYRSYFFHKYEKHRHRYSVDDLINSNSIGLLLIGKGIGDAIVLSGFICSLRDCGKKVYCICNNRTAVVFNSLIETDGIYILSDNAKREEVSELNLSFDTLVLFTDPDYKLYKNLSILTAIEHKYALGYNQEDERFWDVNVLRDEVGMHCSDRYIDAAKRLGVDIEDYRYSLKFSPECLSDIELFLSNLKGQRFVVFNPKASDKFRSLSEEIIRRTISWLQENSSLQIVVYNVIDDNLIKDYPQVIFNPFKDIDHCIALLGRSSFLITVDTSFVHAGRFFDLPMIAIYNNRLDCKKYDNNVYWGPNYAKANQVFSIDHVNTETGDDLRLLPFNILERALTEAKDLI